jgi:drug/metabolite transporter (DMT)-like permease
VRRDWIIVSVGLLAVSWSAPLIRLASDVPPLSIAFWRSAIATALLLPLVVIHHREEVRGLERRDLLAMLLTGAMLALHFATWIASVNMTTVASSVLLVASQPIFVAIASTVMGERPSKKLIIGIIVAVAGGLLVTGGDIGASGKSLTGDGLAIAGAIAGSGYLLMGRRLRARLSVLTYVVIVYGSCAVLLAVAMLIRGTPFAGYASRGWILIVAIALGPQLLGHTSFNLLLDRMDATQVAVAIMGEPVISSFIAALLFAELPGFLVIPGGFLLLTGIRLALRGQGVELVPIE